MACDPVWLDADGSRTLFRDAELLAMFGRFWSVSEEALFGWRFGKAGAPARTCLLDGPGLPFSELLLMVRSMVKDSPLDLRCGCESSESSPAKSITALGGFDCAMVVEQSVPFTSFRMSVAQRECQRALLGKNREAAALLVRAPASLILDMRPLGALTWWTGARWKTPAEEMY